MSRHVDEGDLILYYYGEGRERERARVERHLDECPTCRAQYRQISGTLSLVATPEAPDRGSQYGLEVWQRLRIADFEASNKLWSFGRPVFGRFSSGPRLAAASALAVAVLAAFIAGRTWRPAPSVALMPAPTPNPSANGTPADAGHRILLSSVLDQLDSSERVLTDIMSVDGGSGSGSSGVPANALADISMDQRWAEDLLTASRLYRQDAANAGEQSLASLLDDVERSLLEIVNSPANIDLSALEQIRRRIDAAALLFKVRIMSDEIRRRGAQDTADRLPRTPRVETHGAAPSTSS